MKESTNPVPALTPEQRVELELLHSLLEEESSYPWNPADPAAAVVLDRLAQSFEEGELSPDIFESQWSQVAQLAEQLWAQSDALTTRVAQRFATRMPKELVQQLVQAARATSNQGLALIDQLVASAQSVLTGWEVEDLQVMARPLALSMRGGQEEALTVMLRSVRETEWENLTEMEKARLSLAISRYILGELTDS